MSDDSKRQIVAVKKENKTDIVALRNIGNEEKENWIATGAEINYPDGQKFVKVRVDNKYDSNYELKARNFQTTKDGLEYTKSVVYDKNGNVLGISLYVDKDGMSKRVCTMDPSVSKVLVDLRTGQAYTGFFSDKSVERNFNSTCNEALSIANKAKNLEDTIEMPVISDTKTK